MALAGTSVISGGAVMLVCETGRDTSLGQIADTLIAKPPPTSFEIGLRRFSMLILRITFFALIAPTTPRGERVPPRMRTDSRI